VDHELRPLPGRDELARGDWLCIFEHDTDQPLGRIVEEPPGRFHAVPAFAGD